MTVRASVTLKIDGHKEKDRLDHISKQVNRVGGGGWGPLAEKRKATGKEKNVITFN